MRGLAAAAAAAIVVLSVLESAGAVRGTETFSLVSFSFFTSRQTSKRSSFIPSHKAKRPLANFAVAPSEPPSRWHKGSLGPVPGPALSPKLYGHAPAPSMSRHHHHHRKVPPAYSPSSFNPKSTPDCVVTCSDPLTSTPFGSPCGCVLPLQVELDLEVAPFRVFTVVPELEVEVAAGTYVKQSQVRIMAAVSSGQNQDKTRVDIDLVPLGEKFDSMTAFLIFERFWQKKVPINASIFGNYEVIYVKYPGLPSSPTSMPQANSPGSSQLPFTANVPVGRSRKLNPRVTIIVAISSFILVLICIGLICVIPRWKELRRSTFPAHVAFSSPIVKRSGMRSMMSSSIISSASVSLVSTMATYPPSVKTFTLAELESATDKFSAKKVLGEGGFGRVYHGIMENGMEVAIKLLTREDQSGDREFIAEVEMLSRLHHRNLVKLIGICIEGYTRCLVYELVCNGSVESHLHGADREKSPLDWDTRMKIALGSARGLAYLHEDSNPRVIHRDFKASNVLLEDDFTPKVSDFGLAREASEGSHHISTRVMGTFGYVAPEYAMTGHLLVKSDVYSYGVVLLELLSGRKPVDMSQPQGQENLVTWSRPLLTSREGIEQLVDHSLRGSYNFDYMAKVAAIASMCVHPEVSNRPFMGEVVQALKLICNDIDETCEDSCSQRDSSAPDCDYKGETGTGSSWWNAGTPRLTFGYASSFVTMEYSSGPMEELERPRSDSMTRLNRSGPLRTSRHKRLLERLRGSMSEHGFLSRRLAADRYWF